jgi:hypothetical protein
MAVRLAADKSTSTAITLNGTGRKLLSQFKRLEVTLTLSLSTDGQSSPITSRRITVRP